MMIVVCVFENGGVSMELVRAVQVSGPSVQQRLWSVVPP